MINVVGIGKGATFFYTVLDVFTTINDKNMKLKEREIIEGNKLIADFIGLKIRYTQSAGWNGEQGDWDMEIDCPDAFDHDEQLMYLYDEGEPESCFKFHKDWNWLKIAVDNIFEYALAHPAQVDKIRSVSIVACKEAVFRVVVDFIKWHNKQS